MMVTVLENGYERLSSTLKFFDSHVTRQRTLGYDTKVYSVRDSVLGMASLFGSQLVILLSCTHFK